MKVTYNWLKDFVEIKITPPLLADKLTMAGLEVTALEKRGSDWVFEIEITPNRADLLSVIGIAREVAAVTNSKLQIQNSKPQFKIKNYKKEIQPLKIEIQDKRDCPLYTAKIIRDAQAGPSPDWLKQRLELVGCRSVNSVVDITNYILFEWGEPLHAFDLDKLVSWSAGRLVNQLNIIVRRTRDGEEITTIDGIKRILNPEILIIASGVNKGTGKPIAIAGIMGGRDTEVTATTKNILLEAAVFNPLIVRRGRRILGLTSESAYRFERGVELEAVEDASWAAVKLIQEAAAGRCVLAKSSKAPKIKKKSINLDVTALHKFLGTDIPAVKIKKILSSLEFKLKTKTRDCLIVEVPGHRPDVNLGIDLIEEIARIFGYENIPQSLPAVAPQISTAHTAREAVSSVKNILAGLGLYEVITYGLIAQDLLRSFGIEADCPAIEILNPLSKEQEVLRPKLIPSLAACVSRNLNQKQDYVNIFEIAKTFSALDKSTPKEELTLGIALCGAKAHLFAPGRIKEELGVLHLKGILEVLFERLGIKSYSFYPQEESGAIGVYVNREKIGVIVELKKSTLERLEIKNKEVFALEVSLERIFSFTDLKKKFIALPKYPGITRDISLILKDDISIKEILEVIKLRGQPLLRNIKIIDYYKGKQIPAGYRGLTISCLYRADERTLTEAEINPLHTLIGGILTEQFGAQIR